MLDLAFHIPFFVPYFEPGGYFDLVWELVETLNLGEPQPGSSSHEPGGWNL